MAQRAILQRWWRKAHTVFSDCDIAIAAFPAMEREAITELVRKVISIRGVAVGLSRSGCAYIPRASLKAVSKLSSRVIRDLRRSIRRLQHARQPLPAAVNRTGRPGRPSIDLGHLQLQRNIALHNQGCSWKDIAESSGFSRRLLHKRLQEAGIRPQRSSFTDITDEALQRTLREFLASNPHSGISVAQGFLRTRAIRIQRERVAIAMKAIDPVGSGARYQPDRRGLS